MLEDLRALVEFAQAGSITVQPIVYSARPLRITRQVQG